MSKFRTSWTLMKRSMQVIRDHKKLLLFPVVITLLTGVIGLFFVAPIGLWDTGHAYTTAEHWKAVADRWVVLDSESHHVYVRPAGYGLMAGLYLVSMFLATFFNVAFYHEVLHALNDQPVSVSGGLRFATTRLKAILIWSLFTGLVGLVIKALEERFSAVGRWAIGLVGMAWSVASIFVAPVIVREPKQTSPIGLLKSSAGALRRTWGESLIGFMGIRIGGVFAFVISLLWMGTTVGLTVVYENGWILAAGTISWILCLVVLAYVVHVASQVYLGALYVYATEGVTPGPFSQEDMDAAWKVKSGRHLGT